MANKPNQDLADKALAEEFGTYISAVAAAIVTPINESAQKTQFTIGNSLKQAENSFHESAQKTQSSISESAQKAQSSISNSAQMVQSSISNSAQMVQSSIGSSLKEAKDSISSLTNTLGNMGVELKETVASVYEGHETTRKHLINLLHQHRDLAKTEAAEQVQQLGQAIQSDLGPRLEVLLKDGLVKPVTAVIVKSSLEQAEFAKQIARQILKEFRDSSGETTRKLDGLSEKISEAKHRSDGLDEKTEQLIKFTESVQVEAGRRHRQNIVILGIGVALQIVLIVLLATGVGR